MYIKLIKFYESILYVNTNKNKIISPKRREVIPLICKCKGIIWKWVHSIPLNGKPSDNSILKYIKTDDINCF